MNKYFFAALLFTSFPLMAQEAHINVDTPTITSEAEIDHDKPFNLKENHWLVAFGAEGLAYKAPFEFNGVRKDITPSSQEMWGGRLSVGREFYLNNGFITSSRAEGYYVGTLFNRIVSADPDVSNIDIAFTKRTGQVYGADIVQTLSYVFDFKTKNPFMGEMTYLTVEPFVEIGVGFAQAYNRLNYHYNTGNVPGSGQVREDYRASVEDVIANQRFGGGFNLISKSGYFFYLKSSINRYDISKRKIQGTQRFDDQEFTKIDESVNNPKIAPVTIYAIGGGYKF